MSDRQPPAPPPRYGSPAPVRTNASGTNGLAITGFVLGILGLLFCWIPFLNFLAILLGILGLIFAAIGLVQSKNVNTGKGLAIAGLAMSALAVILAIVINVAFVNAIDDAFDSSDDSDVPHSTVPASPGSKAAGGSGSSGKTAGKEGFVDGVLTTADLKIEITDHKIIPAGQTGNEYGDKPVIAFWYKITNLSDDKTSPMNWLYVISAYQDNNPNAENELEVSSLPDDRFLDTQSETIKKGGTVENAVAYELDDLTTPVELRANDSLGFGDDLGRVTYELK